MSLIKRLIRNSRNRIKVHSSKHYKKRNRNGVPIIPRADNKGLISVHFLCMPWMYSHSNIVHQQLNKNSEERALHFLHYSRSRRRLLKSPWNRNIWACNVMRFRWNFIVVLKVLPHVYYALNWLQQQQETTKRCSCYRNINNNNRWFGQ